MGNGMQQGGPAIDREGRSFGDLKRRDEAGAFRPARQAGRALDPECRVQRARARIGAEKPRLLGLGAGIHLAKYGERL